MNPRLYWRQARHGGVILLFDDRHSERMHVRSTRFCRLAFPDRRGTIAGMPRFMNTGVFPDRDGKEDAMADFDSARVTSLLNRILEQELAGVVRYTHYSFLIFGHGRIPIVSWLRAQADESLRHAHQAGEMITILGAYPSLEIGPLLDTHRLEVDTILREALDTERKALALYRSLLDEVAGKSVMLEEYARQMIYAEELHAGEVEKMLSRPGRPAAETA